MAGKAKLIIVREGGKYGLYLLIFLEKVVHFSAVIWCTFHLLFANLRSIQINSYFYFSFLSLYEREGYFPISKDIHSYIDEGFGLVDVFNDGFFWAIIEGEVDFGFG